MTDKTPTPPAPRPLPNRPVMDPAERAKIDAERQAHMRATVPQHNPANSATDIATMSDEQLREHILAKHRRILALTSRDALLLALAAATEALVQMKAVAEAREAEAPAPQPAPEATTEGLDVAETDPVSGLAADELEARFGAAGPAAKAAIKQQAEKLAAKAAEAAEAAKVPEPAETPAQGQESTAGVDLKQGEAVSGLPAMKLPQADDSPPVQGQTLTDAELNADLEAANVEFDPSAPYEERLALHASLPQEPRQKVPGPEDDTDGDGREDGTGEFTGAPINEGLAKHRQLKADIKALGGTPKGNTAALEAQLAYLREQQPEAPAGGEGK